MVCGFAWHECGDLTTSSDSTPSMCALEYATTPSLPCSTGPVPSTEMIECAGIDGDDRDVLQSLDEGVSRRHVVDRGRHDAGAHRIAVPRDVGGDADELHRQARDPSGHD